MVLSTDVSAWGSWSSCSATCGMGMRYRISSCGGQPCPGDLGGGVTAQREMCEVVPCHDTERDV